MRKVRLIAILAAMSMLVLLLAAPASAVPPERTYEVTITNLTDGQPLTPALVGTHKGNDGLFTVGDSASFGLKEIAENGNLGPMLDRVKSDRDFGDVALGFGAGPPPIVPGETISFSITAAPPFNFLSWASMLVCTNDGFTGVDTVELPNRVGQSVTLHTEGYDAGTEINTELFADIVPPCAPLTGQDNGGQVSGPPPTSDPALAENGVIHHHDGIEGVTVPGFTSLDPAINDWDNPVAVITIERTG